MHIYIYRSYYWVQVWPFLIVIIWSKFVFLETLFVKNTINIVVSADLFEETNCARNFSIFIIWSKLAFVLDPQLGPDNNPTLDQIRTILNGHFFLNLCWHTELKYLILQCPDKNVRLNLSFWISKTFMLNKKHNLKSGETSNIKNGCQRENKTGNRQKRDWWKQFCNILFWCCSFHETKAKKKERDKNKEPKEKKKNKKEGRQKKQEIEIYIYIYIKRERETEKEKVKKGEAKKDKEKQKATKRKTKKQKTKKQKNKKTQKYKNKNSVFRQTFLFFFWGPKCPFFGNLAKKARTPKHYIKIWVSAKFFCNRCASRNGHFWTPKPKTGNSSYRLLFAFFFSFFNKKHKHMLKPYFIVF